MNPSSLHSSYKNVISK